MSVAFDNSKRKYFAFSDLLVAVVILIAAAVGVYALFGSSSEGDVTAVISVGGQVYSEISLSDVSEPYDVTLEGDGTVALHVSSEGVRFANSECPDKLCVNTGLLTRTGQSAVCLPCRVSVKLVSDNSADADLPDAVVG